MSAINWYTLYLISAFQDFQNLLTSGQPFEFTRLCQGRHLDDTKKTLKSANIDILYLHKIC